VPGRRQAERVVVARADLVVLGDAVSKGSAMVAEPFVRDPGNG